MLPYIEQNPLYQSFQSNAWVGLQKAYVELLICPSRNPGSDIAPLSYVVNAGVTDKYFGVAKAQMDFQANGVFFDEYAHQYNNAVPKAPTTDVAWIGSHDGTSMTLVLSENLDAKDWITVGTPATSMPHCGYSTTAGVQGRRRQ